MAFGADKKKLVAEIGLATAALLLMFGTVPFLNLSTNAPLFGSITLGNLIGIVVGYSVYLIHKNQI